MSRVQLALNVSDLEASVVFYTHLFGVAPHKRRPGYANFAIEEPALKLVLIEVPADQRGTGVQGALNHLGVEVAEWVSCRITHAIATDCIHVPLSDTAWPKKNLR